MSVKIIGLLWECDLPQNEKFVAIAYADHADHDGNNIYPSYALLEKKTGYKKRQLQRITSSLESKGVLIDDGEGPYGTNKWRMDVPNLPYAEWSDFYRGVKMTPPAAQDNDAEIDEKPEERVSFLHGGVSPSTPKPSLKPSVNLNSSNEELETAVSTPAENSQPSQNVPSTPDLRKISPEQRKDELEHNNLAPRGEATGDEGVPAKSLSTGIAAPKGVSRPFLGEDVFCAATGIPYQETFDDVAELKQWRVRWEKPLKRMRKHCQTDESFLAFIVAAVKSYNARREKGSARISTPQTIEKELIGLVAERSQKQVAPSAKDICPACSGYRIQAQTVRTETGFDICNSEFHTVRITP